MARILDVEIRAYYPTRCKINNRKYGDNYKIMSWMCETENKQRAWIWEMGYLILYR